MDALNLTNFAFFMLCLFCAALNIYSCLIRTENKRLKAKLSRTRISQQHLLKKFSYLEKKIEAKTTFEAKLHKVQTVPPAVKPKLKESPLPAENIFRQGTSLSTPEKYKHIKILVARGRSPEEIAGSMSISLQEALQIISLTQIGFSSQTS